MFLQELIEDTCLKGITLTSQYQGSLGDYTSGCSVDLSWIWKCWRWKYMLMFMSTQTSSIAGTGGDYPFWFSHTLVPGEIDHLEHCSQMAMTGVVSNRYLKRCFSMFRALHGGIEMFVIILQNRLYRSFFFYHVCIMETFEDVILLFWMCRPPLHLFCGNNACNPVALV